MKYLISFNESYSTELSEFTTDLQETIREILLPISDMGYNIKIRIRDFGVLLKHQGKQIETVLSVGVVSTSDKPLVITNDVKEDFIRMCDYIYSEGLGIKVACFDLVNQMRILSFEDFILLSDQQFRGGNLTVKSLTFNIKR